VIPNKGLIPYFPLGIYSGSLALSEFKAIIVNVPSPLSHATNSDDILTETNVPGRKNIVTAAIVIIEELSRWATRAIAVVAFEI
jgi:hypothetical protein